MVARAVPVSIAAERRSGLILVSTSANLLYLGERQRVHKLTIVSLPPGERILSDEIVESKAEDKPQRILGYNDVSIEPICNEDPG